MAPTLQQAPPAEALLLRYFAARYGLLFAAMCDEAAANSALKDAARAAAGLAGYARSMAVILP